MNVSPARLAGAGVISLGLSLAILVNGPDVQIRPDTVQPESVPDPEAYVRAREAAVDDPREGGEALIVWADPETKARTPLSLVYLHGFSADRQEIAPVPQQVAEALGANLFLARLTGHGRTSFGAMAEATGEDWLADGLEAMAVGQALGERTIVMGTSTGGTLALWLAASGAPEAVDALVLVSPNLHPADPNARLMLWPWGGTLLELVMGPERRWEPVNAAHAAHWSHHYPSRALLPMMGLVELIEHTDLSAIRRRVLVVRDPLDGVVSGEATVRSLSVLDPAPAEVLIASDDPDHHVIAGDAMSPRTTQEVVEATLAWLGDQGLVPAAEADATAE